MRRGVSAFLVVALSAVPALAQAQSYVFLGGAASLPLSTTKDALKTGWLADVGVGKTLGQGGNLSINVEGLYGTSSYKVGSGSMTLYGAFVNLETDINQAAKLHPYVYVGGGMLTAKPEQGDSKSKGAYQAGAGLSYKLSAQWTLWSDVRYLGTASGDPKTTFLPISFGLTKSFGGGM